MTDEDKPHHILVGNSSGMPQGELHNGWDLHKVCSSKAIILIVSSSKISACCASIIETASSTGFPTAFEYYGVQYVRDLPKDWRIK
jgi:hypothetical protein